MSNDSLNMNPNWAPPAPRPGMSGSTKVLIGMGIGCGLMVLLCCGGLFGVGFYMQSWVKQSVSQDPAATQKLAAEMLKIDVPEGLKPTMAFRPKKLPLAGKAAEFFPSFAVYADRGTESMLILASAGAGTPAQTRAQIKNQMDAILQQPGAGDEEDLEVEPSYPKEVKVGDPPITFTLTKGKSPKSGRTRILVTGTFQGNSGPVMLALSVDAEKYDEAAVRKMLESIRVDAGKADAKKPEAKKPDAERLESKKPDAAKAPSPAR